jgi:hypothetical protein
VLMAAATAPTARPTAAATLTLHGMSTVHSVVL